MAQLKEVKSMLRATLMSCKEGVPAHVLQKDYREITGEPLPFRQLGFNNLDDFIKSISDVVEIRQNRNGEIVYHAVASEKTAHIQSLVSKQKSVKKKRHLVPVSRRPVTKANFPSPAGHRLNGGARPSDPRPLTGQRSIPIINRWGESASDKRRYPRGLHVVVSDSQRQVRKVAPGNNLLNKAMSDANNQRKTNSFRSNTNRLEVPPRFNNAKKRETLSSSVKGQGPKRPVHRFEQISKDEGERYVDVLDKYGKDHNISLTFDTKSVQSESQTVYFSSLKIDNKVYGSEDLYMTEAEAEYAVCRNACYALGLMEESSTPAKHGLFHSMCAPFPLGSKHVDEDLVKHRIMELLKNKTGGLWKKNLLVQYKENYNEDPPSNINKLLHKWTDSVRITTTQTEDNEIIAPVPEDLPKPPTLIKHPNEDKAPAGPRATSPVTADKSKKSKGSGLFKTSSPEKVDVEKLMRLTYPKGEYLPIGEKVTVYVTFIHSCGYFCVQREDSPIDEISQKLEQHVQNKELPKPTRKQLVPGTCCAAMYSVDNSWSRAEVVKQDDTGCGVQLLYVDYGNTDKSYPSAICWLSETLAAFPVQVVYCSLHNIQPLSTEEEWSREAIELFAKMVENQTLVALTKEYSDEGVCEVELFLADDGDDVSINEKLVAAKVVESSSAVNSILIGEPEPIQLPETDQWDVYVSFINSSSSSVMIRLVGKEFSEKLDKFEVCLQDAFHKAKDEPKIEVGRVYIAYVDFLFHRVRVLEVDDDKKKANCLFLDHGDTDFLLYDELREMPEKLNKSLPYQLVEVSLSGLEDIGENITVLESLFEVALGKTLVADVVERSDIYSIILTDTSGKEDVNINEVVLQTYNSEVTTSLLTSHSSPVGSMANLSDRSSTGSRSKDASPVRRKQDPVNSNNLVSSQNSTVTCTRNVNSHSPKKFAEYASFQGDAGALKTGSDVSCVVNSVKDQNANVAGKIGVHAIDGSVPGVVDNQTGPLYTWDSTPNPHSQAGGDAAPRGTVPGEDYTDDSKALLEPTFYHTRPQDTVPREDYTDDSKALWEPTLYHARPLPPQGCWPKTGECKDVFVLSAFDPHNFICRPLESLMEFNQFSDELNQYFVNNPPQNRLDVKDVKMNHMYAGLSQADGLWYRVQVINMQIPDNMFSIYLPELGEYNFMNVEDIVPLPWKFWSLPYQAFRAKIDGVRPPKNSAVWSPEARSKMQELCAERALVAYISKVDENKVYYVHLIDTSDANKDILIEEELVSLGLAEFV